MLYEDAKIRSLGDLSIIVEFGDEHDIRLSFRVITLEKELKKRKINGICETVPVNACLGIIYNPLIISQGELILEIKEIEKDLKNIREVSSRLFKIPIYYNDPWSCKCAEAHGRKNDVEYIAEVNNISVDEVIKIHSGTDWWVSGVGFTPGCFQSQPIDTTKVLTAPKYPSPRKWTDERILCYAGHITSFYPVRSPGGYQLIGRAPINMYDPKQRYSIFSEGPVISKVSDRHRYYPVGEKEYYEILNLYENGKYVYEVEEGTFCIDEYEQKNKSREMKHV